MSFARQRERARETDDNERYRRDDRHHRRQLPRSQGPVPLDRVPPIPLDVYQVVDKIDPTRQQAKNRERLRGGHQRRAVEQALGKDERCEYN